MGIQLFANNAATRLASAITAVQLILTVEAGKGALFPSPSGGDFFLTTLENTSTGEFEIAKVTSRAGDVFTIVRAQENTQGLVFPAGASVELRITKETLEGLQTLALTGGAQATFHDFATPQATWSIIHNLNKYPGAVTFEATFVDPANPVIGDEILGDISYIDANTMQVTFGGTAVAGRAYLN